VLQRRIQANVSAFALFDCLFEHGFQVDFHPVGIDTYRHNRDPQPHVVAIARPKAARSAFMLY
jgi:hypothetical protein